MQRPELQHTAAARGKVGYHVFGEGNVPVVLVHAALTSIATNWEHPLMVRLWSLYNRFARVVDFDQRGCGVSDPLPAEELGSLDEWVADVLAVMDAAEMPTANLAAGAEGVAVAVAVAVQHPERVERLVLADGFAKGSLGPHYPWGPPPEVVDMAGQFIEQRWGTGEAVAMAVPTFAGDPDLCRRMEEAVGSSSAAAGLYRAARAIDVRSLLPQVAAPTLVVVTTTEPDMVAQSRYLAERIPGAALAELPDDEFFWGDARGEEIFNFLKGSDWRAGDRAHAVILFTDIVGSTERAMELGDARWRDVLDAVEAYMAATVAHAGGRVVKTTGDGVLAEFTDASAAVRAALAMSLGVTALGVSIRAGIHAGEVERRGTDVGGISVHIAARVMALADPGDVLVTRVVRDGAEGDDLAMVAGESHVLRGVEGEWELFRAVRP